MRKTVLLVILMLTLCSCVGKTTNSTNDIIVDETEAGSEDLDKGPTEIKHITQATWGAGHDEQMKFLNTLYQERSLEENLANKMELQYVVGMMDRPWETYFNFNDNDELYRVDMTMSERVIGEDEDGAHLEFLFDLLYGMYETYGLVDGYLYPTEVTTDFVTAYKDPSIREVLGLLQEFNFVSVTYRKDEMVVWLVIQREDFGEDMFEIDIQSVLMENNMDIIKGKRKLEDSVLPEKFDELEEPAEAVAVDRDSLYTVYIGFLNTLYDPPVLEEMELIEEDELQEESFDLSQLDDYLIEKYNQ